MKGRPLVDPLEPVHPLAVRRERIAALEHLIERATAELITERRALRRSEASRNAMNVTGNLSAPIRAWGRTMGWNVGDRGRLPTDLIEAYRSAHNTATQETT